MRAHGISVLPRGNRRNRAGFRHAKAFQEEPNPYHDWNYHPRDDRHGTTGGDGWTTDGQQILAYPLPPAILKPAAPMAAP